MSLTMTPEDICKEYRTAKSPLKQIGVLAELNACPKGEIIQVLRDNGEKLPGNVGPRKAAAAPALPEPGVAPQAPEGFEVWTPTREKKAEARAPAPDLTPGNVNYQERKAAPGCEAAQEIAPVDEIARIRAASQRQRPPASAFVLRRLIVKAFGGNAERLLEDALAMYVDAAVEQAEAWKEARAPNE